MKKLKVFIWVLAVLLMAATPAMAGINDRFSDIELDENNYIIFPEISAPTGDPPTNYGWLYIKDSGGVSTLYFEDDGGTVNSVYPATVLWNSIANPDAADTIDFTTYTAALTSAVITGYSFTFTNTGAFNAGEGVVNIIQVTGNPDGGDLLYATMADPDINGIRIYHSGDPAAGAMLELDQAANDDAQAIFIQAKDNAVGDVVFKVGQGGDVTISETTLITEAILDFSAGAGEINTAAGSALTLSADDGGAAGEDLIIIAQNVALTAVGLMSFTPDAALDTAIDLTAANIDHGIKLADNDINFTTGSIEGTTAVIDFTDFDVSADGAIIIAPDDGGTGIDITPGAALAIGVDLSDAAIVAAIDIGANTIISTGGVFAVTAAGDITCNDVNATGTVTGATIAQDAIVPASGDPTPLQLDGTATGGVTVGGTSTGTITLGGGATLVSLAAATDLTLAGGQVSITDTANADVVTIVNNTLTTQELINASSTSLTSGKGLQLGVTAMTDGTGLYIGATEATLTTGRYIGCWDNAAWDFTVSKYGATVIAGNAAATDALTLTNGDILVSAGHIDITTGTFTVGTGSVAVATNGNFSSARGGIKLDSVDDDNSYIKRNQAVTAAPLLELESTNILDDQAALLVDHDATGAIDAITITTDNTGNADAIDLTMTGVDADVLAITVPAAYAGQIIQSDLLAWVGTAGQGGIIDVVTTAAATAEVGQGIRLNYLGTAASGAAVLGKGLHVHANAGAQAGESLVYLDTLFNDAIHIKNGGVSADGIKFDVEDSYVGQGIVADLGPWIGTVNQGFIQITTDAANADVVGQAIRVNLQDDDVDVTAISGKGLFVKEVSAYKLGTYLAHFESTSNNALFVSGDVSFGTVAPFLGATPIVFDGATFDADVLSVTVTDPTTAKALNIPDSNVNMELIGNIMVGLTTYTESAVATEVITEATVAIAAGHAAAGQVYTWEIAGEKTGANNTYAIILVLDGTTALTLTASDATAATFTCRVTLIMVDADNMLAYGELIENGKVAVQGRATVVDNLAGAINIGLSMTLANAGDEVKTYNTIVTYNE